MGMHNSLRGYLRRVYFDNKLTVPEEKLFDLMTKKIRCVLKYKKDTFTKFFISKGETVIILRDSDILDKNREDVERRNNFKKLVLHKYNNNPIYSRRIR
jgi:hypothetical protein